MVEWSGDEKIEVLCRNCGCRRFKVIYFNAPPDSKYWWCNICVHESNSQFPGIWGRLSKMENVGIDNGKE